MWSDPSNDLCAGVVEHVVLMGVPVSTRVERWAMARSAVAGRFVNAFSRRDWVRSQLSAVTLPRSDDWLHRSCSQSPSSVIPISAFTLVKAVIV